MLIAVTYDRYNLNMHEKNLRKNNLKMIKGSMQPPPHPVLHEIMLMGMLMSPENLDICMNFK